MLNTGSIDPLRNFGFLIRDLSRLYARNFERHSVDLGLTLDQCKALCYLQRNEGISQVRLAYLTDIDPMTLGRLLERMAADGLIERRPDPSDGRAHQLFLLNQSSPVLEEIWRVSDDSRAESMAGLSGTEREQLLHLLQRLHVNLDELIPGAADRIGGASKNKKLTVAKS